jgi:ubiquinone/menaquinone biosynthesis C-methylase UbiE
MSYQEHKKHFGVAYKTGTDVWTHQPTNEEVSKLIEKLPAGAYILDIGSGRGFLAKHLADLGSKVIGLDFEGEIVAKANENIKDWGLEGKLKFVEADALKIPFADLSFDAICDFGLFETLFKEDWPVYVAEIIRVLKPGGFYLNVSLSRETQHFFEFSPKAGPEVDFEKYGIHYHFFEKEEMQNIFATATTGQAGKLSVISQETELAKKENEVVLLQTLFRKQ